MLRNIQSVGRWGIHPVYTSLHRLNYFIIFYLKYCQVTLQTTLKSEKAFNCKQQVYGKQMYCFPFFPAVFYYLYIFINFIWFTT